MTIATLRLDEATKLEFAVSITGAGGKPESRFVIEGKDFNISYPCRQTNEGVEVEIVGLKDVLKAGEYDVRLEVFLENKVYTPLRDKITFEPTVEVSTKQKPVLEVKESVKIGKITVKKPVINEDLMRKTHAATIIAKSLGYQPNEGETPKQIIERALEHTPIMSPDQLKTLTEMLKLAESVGISYDHDLMPVITETVIQEMKAPIAASEDDEDDMSDSEIDDMIKHINDWDDVMDAYEPGELGIIDDETGEEVQGDMSDELSESELNEVLSRVERIKSRMRFHRTSAKRERKLKVALKRKSSGATINKRARHLAVKTMEARLAKGRNIATLSVPEKERIERIVQKRSKLVGRMAMKLTSRVRQIERDRLSHKSYTK